jgi:REP-associated tyrosine transposase
MQWVSVSYSVYFNRRHRRSGHLFQGRYKSSLVDTGTYLIALSRYIDLNPMRGRSIGRGTPSERRTRLRAFRWSSYRGYAGLAKSLPFVDESQILQAVSQAERIEYRRFVEDGLVREIENPFAAVKWRTALGHETFLRKLRDRMRALQKERREVTPLRRAAEFASPEAILNNVAKKFRTTAQCLTQRRGYGLEPRNLAMWIISEHCGITLRQIGELFGGLDYAAVAQRIRRARQRYSDREARELLAQMSNV